MAKLFANSGDPDQMLQSCRMSDLGLHCLPVDLTMKLIYNFTEQSKWNNTVNSFKSLDKQMHVHFHLYEVNRKITLFVLGFKWAELQTKPGLISYPFVGSPD